MAKKAPKQTDLAELATHQAAEAAAITTVAEALDAMIQSGELANDSRERLAVQHQALVTLAAGAAARAEALTLLG